MSRRRSEQRLVFRVEKRFNLCLDGRTGGSEQSLALVHWKINHFVKKAFDFFPIGPRVHNLSVLISRSSQVRASRQSRFTVTTETPKASAISSILKPPK